MFWIKNNLTWPKCKAQLNKNKLKTHVWPFYVRVGEPTRLTTSSTRMSRVLNEPGQKSTRIEICKKISTQPDPNPWWVGLAREFQPILKALIIILLRRNMLQLSEQDWVFVCF